MIIDISAPVDPSLPVWPGSPGFHLDHRTEDVDGDQTTNSTLTTDVHVGTHVEAPRHFLADGATLDAIPLDVLVGPAYVANLGDCEVITGDVLDRAGVPEGTTRLLMRTTNSRWWPGDPTFREDYVALDESGAAWCVDRELALVGIDYLSVQSWTAGPETHRQLMRAGTPILEGLALRAAAPGRWHLTCLPLALRGVEAAPARAVLSTL